MMPSKCRYSTIYRQSLLKSIWRQFEQVNFIPFDPVRKRTEAMVRTGDGYQKVSKGAAQILLEMCGLDDAESSENQPDN